MKHYIALLMVLLCFGCALPGLSEPDAYPDGIYRGFYYEGGIEQIAIEFELRGGVFSSIEYRGVKYKDGDYMIEDASDAQKATLRQYHQLAGYLIGKELSAIDELYFPYEIVDDVDAVTTATMQSSKLVSALWDGLNRRPYKLVDTTRLPPMQAYGDGVYRGCYMEGGEEQVALEFTLRGNVFVSVSFRELRYRGEDYLAADRGERQTQIAAQFDQLIAYLVGKPVDAISDLYRPQEIASDTDALSGATLDAPKVISAVWDGLNRRVYRLD